MTTPAQRSALMSEVQERLKLKATRDPATEGVWSLPLDPVHPIRVRFDPGRAQLVFSRSIGIPPAGDQTFAWSSTTTGSRPPAWALGWRALAGRSPSFRTWPSRR